MSLISRFIAKGSNKAKVATPSPTRYGTVVSVSGQTANVVVDGNSEVTPCTTAVGCKVGQRVVVEVNNGIALVTGNVTAPSPDGTTIDEIIGNTLIRETSDGILVAKVSDGIGYGALVNSEGSFDVVQIYWSDGEPTIMNEAVKISKNLQRFFVGDNEGLFKIESENADGQPLLQYVNGSLLVGFMAGTNLAFSPLSQSSILSIQSGQLNPTTDFSVEADGGIITSAFSMPASTSTLSGASVFVPATASASGDPTVTRTSASAVVWGKFCDISVSFTIDQDVSVNATGNIANITVGTIPSALRPKVASDGHSHGDNAGQCHYSIGTGGVVQLCACEGTGSARTIAAGTTFNMHAHYLLA